MSGDVGPVVGRAAGDEIPARLPVRPPPSLRPHLREGFVDRRKRLAKLIQQMQQEKEAIAKALAKAEKKAHSLQEQVGDKVLLLEQNPSQWVNATIQDAVKEVGEYRYCLMIDRDKEHKELETETPTCQALLNATAFEEELSKMKAFYRARHSSIIDALSGTRLDAVSHRVRASKDQKTSWTMIVNALERFNKATPSCTPNAFWVIGAPGSGKNCLMCRLIMDSVSRFDNLVPLRLPIMDLVKRTDQMPERDQSSVRELSGDELAWLSGGAVFWVPL
eukprot:g1510.t1